MECRRDRSLEWCEKGNTRIPENLVVRSALGKAKKTELFFIPSSTEISSFCPECEEKGRTKMALDRVDSEVIF